MCGINILLIPSKVPLQGDAMHAAMARMQAALAHRGPDDAAYVPIEARGGARICMGAVRLALRGGDSGRQPLGLDDGSILVYNGELFGEDMPEGDLAALGHALDEKRTDFDPEGMYAYVYYEAGASQLHLRRDPFGIKPLWQSPVGDAHVISSELRGLAAYDAAVLQPKPAALAELLSYRCVHGQAGLFEAIEPAAPDPFRLPAPPDPQNLKSVLTESLLQNLTSDKPVGLMLSGGIDSGLLACLAAEAGVKLPCFTTESPEYEHAAALAKRLGHPIHKVHVPRGTEDWLEFLHHSPAPIADPGGYMTWCVARAARAEGVPVLLSGAGADEVFLGYRRHAFFHRYRNWINHPFFYLAASALPAMKGRLPQALHPFEPQFADRDIIYYRTLMASPGNLAHYLRMAPYAPNWVFKRKQTVALPEGLPPMPDILWLDLFTYLPDQVLAATDLYSMAHSVEVRVPYLNRKLVSMAWALGPKALLKEGTKTPLRQLFAEYGGTLLPKTGFGPTEAQYPDFHEMDVALGLDRPGHPLYQHLPFAKVARWRQKKMGLQARMAFWCAGIQMKVN